MKTYTITVDIMDNTSQDVHSLPVYNQGDINTSVLNLNITQNDVAYDLTGSTVSVFFIKSDGTVVYQDTTNGLSVTNAINGNVSVSLNTQTLAALGRVIGAVKIQNGNSTLETGGFYFVVKKSLTSEQALASDNEVSPILGTATLTTTDKSIKGAINEVNANKANKTTVGDLTTLTTTDKDTLVHAINDNVNSIGNLSNLTTSDKSSLVNAINSNTSSLATIMTISPEKYTGNAVQKLQSAISDAVTNNSIVKINRMYDITGLGSIIINKAADLGNRRVLYLVSDGGGIIKNDGGYVFDATARNVGDISIRGFRFVSTAGAGAKLWNGNNIIRVNSSNNEYYNWDTIAEANTNYFQSMRFTHEHIVGGNGWAFTCAQMYDTSISNNLMENRQNGICNTQDVSGLLNYSMRISNNVMENFSGVAIKLMGCWASQINNNYFEANAGNSVDLQTLATISSHSGLQVSGNQFTLTSTQLSNGNAAILIGNLSEITSGYTTEGTDGLKSILSNAFIGNSCNGKLFNKTGTGEIVSIGNYTASTDNLLNQEYVFTGLNRHSDNINRYSGLTRGLKFTQTVTIPASTTQLSTLTLYSGNNYAPCKDEDMVQVYVQEVGQVNVLGIYPSFSSANNGTLKVNLQNTTASSITAHLTIVVYKVWE